MHTYIHMVYNSMCRTDPDPCRDVLLPRTYYLLGDPKAPEVYYVPIGPRDTRDTRDTNSDW